MSIDNLLVEQGAPTLAGLKTGNLFPLKTGGEDITPEIRKANRILSAKGIRLIPVKKTAKGVLLYLFRPDRLRKDLTCPEAVCVLKEKGYPTDNPDGCLTCLVRHFMQDETFPHEVGLFLGYPPSDVKAFMESPKDGYQCVGCWKAYSNQEEAQNTFRRYKHCTRVYRKEFGMGRSLESLAVDTRAGRHYQTANR